MSLISKLSFAKLVPLLKRIDKGPLTPQLAQEFVAAVHSVKFDIPKDSSAEIRWQFLGMFLIKMKEEFLSEKKNVPNAQEFVTWVMQEHEALKPQK